LAAKVAEDFAAKGGKNRGLLGVGTESAESITAPSRRQQLNYYKIATVRFEGTIRLW